MPSLALWEPKHLGATGGGKGPGGKGKGAYFSIPSAAPALLHGPHLLTPTLPSCRYPTSLPGSGPSLSCPLPPSHLHQVLQGGGGHSAKASLELMRVQLCRCQCKIWESPRTARSPPACRTLGPQLPPPRLLRRKQGPHPQKRKGRFRRIFPSPESAMTPRREQGVGAPTRKQPQGGAGLSPGLPSPHCPQTRQLKPAPPSLLPWNHSRSVEETMGTSPPPSDYNSATWAPSSGFHPPSFACPVPLPLLLCIVLSRGRLALSSHPCPSSSTLYVGCLPQHGVPSGAMSTPRIRTSEPGPPKRNVRT